MVKNLSAHAGDVREVGLIPGSERSPGGGHGNPLQYSCLENSVDRGAWWGYSPGGYKESTGWKQLSTHHQGYLGLPSGWYTSHPVDCDELNYCLKTH